MNKIDKDFLTIDLNLNGKTFHVVLTDIVKAISKEIGSISENELNYQLGIISFWRQSILGVLYSIRKIRRSLEIEYDIWYSEKSEDARMAIYKRKLSLATQRSVQFVTPSAAEIKDWVFTNYKKEYTELKQKLNYYIHYDELLSKTYDNLVRRGSELQTLARQRMELSKDSSVKDISYNSVHHV